MAGISLRRRIVDLLARSLAAACLLAAIVPLVYIVVTAFQRGYPAIHGSGLVGFLTGPEPLPCSIAAGSTVPCNDYGGISAVLSGSFYLMLVACAVALPVGILAGIFLAEYGRNPLGRTFSFLIDVLAGVPSIVVGIFVWSVMLLYDPAIAFSVISGAGALSIIMLPVVIRTTEESLRLIPQSTREAALALGIPRYRSILQIILPNGGAAVVTGAILAIARAGGESAPLLLLELQPRVGFTGLNHSVTAVPVIIYLWGFLEDVPNWTADAWGAALVLIVIMLSLSLTARLILNRRLPSGGA
jgi:phosphate transport system permease protein